MSPSVIETEVMITASPEAVWRAVTQPSQISSWFSDAAEIDLRPGGEGSLTFGDRATNQRMVVNLQVEAIEPPHLFSFRWVHPKGSQATEANSLLVQFALSAEDGGTRLRVTEGGFDRIDWPAEQKAEHIRSSEKGWSIHLGHLREYVPGSSAERASS